MKYYHEIERTHDHAGLRYIVCTRDCETNKMVTCEFFITKFFAMRYFKKLQSGARRKNESYLVCSTKFEEKK